MKNNQKTKKIYKQKLTEKRKKLAEMERERNTIEERLNSTKRLDELEDDEGRLKRLNEEDQAIIDDTHASELDKEAARERMAARDEELLRLEAQISERENSLSLRDMNKQIFKKIWRDRDSHLSGRGSHYRRGYWDNFQRFKKTRNRFGKLA